MMQSIFACCYFLSVIYCQQCIAIIPYTPSSAINIQKRYISYSERANSLSNRMARANKMEMEMKMETAG